MKKNVVLFILLVISFNSFSQEYSKNRLIVKYKPNTDLNKINQSSKKILSKYADKEVISLAGNNIKLKSTLTQDILLFKFKADINVLEAIKELTSTNLFEYVEPDYIGYGAGKKGVDFFENTPSDALLNRQWGLKNDGTFSLANSKNGADVDMTLAWDITTGNDAITIAVLDSGIRMVHPEFSGRIWANTDESNNSIDSDNNGFIGDVNGWDFVNNDNDPTDDHGHGTNVSGIAVATGNNAIGYAGVDWKCKLMPIKIIDENNSGFYSDWIAGINYAVNNGAKIINMSVGGSSFSQGMKNAVDNAYSNNVIIVACMMNFNNEVPYYPAAYANTIAVGATNPDDTRSDPFFWSNTSGSNYGAHIDVVAPGNYIYGLSYSSSTNYNTYWGGTSQATPLVAGICSLILDQNPNLSVDDVRGVLRDTSEDMVGSSSEDTTGWDKFYGHGRVNAYQALEKVLSVDENIAYRIKLYPNPTINIINLPNTVLGNTYTVYDTLGKEIKKGTITSTKLNIESLKTGTYILKIFVDNKVSINKIIKT